MTSAEEMQKSCHVPLHVLQAPASMRLQLLLLIQCQGHRAGHQYVFLSRWSSLRSWLSTVMTVSLHRSASSLTGTREKDTAAVAGQDVHKPDSDATFLSAESKSPADGKSSQLHSVKVAVLSSLLSLSIQSTASPLCRLGIV